MRCKNCGSQNDDNLYICQNCGSPLYDENEEINNANNYDEDLDKTIVAPPIKKGKQPVPKSRKEAEAEKKKNQQITAVIIALAVVLLAIIIVTVSVVAASHKKEQETTTEIQTSESTTIDQNAYTKATTQTTTETTTTAEKFIINATCGQGGEIEGDGEYAKGEKCALVARADDNYNFVGWYENDSLVSSKEIYRFNVNGDRTIKAVFEEVTTQGYTFVEEEILEGNLEE